MKKWKIALCIFVCILAAGAGTIYYFLYVKEYKTADAKVDKIVKSEYKIQLPSENIAQKQANVPSMKQNPDQAVGGKAETEAVPGKSKTVFDSNHSNKSSEKNPENLTAEGILAKYQPVFKDLENQANSKLNTLLSYAFTEYQTKKEHGEDISYFYFYSKYSSAAKELEDSTDTSFYYIFNALVKELGNSGYNSNRAKPIKDHYINIKKQQRTAILNKAMENFK